jgi:uncharacterized protein YgiM (DUF1202 family)
MIRFSTALALAATLTIAAQSVQAQAVSTDLAERARESCTSKAREKGFELKEVVSTDATPDGGVRVVLNLTRDGANARLTCTLGSDGAVAFGDDTTAATAVTPERTYSPLIPPWLGLLLPLAGLIPLLLWAKGRDAAEYERRATTVRAGDRYEGVVRTDGQPLDVHSGPSSTSRVIGNLRNGQRVTLSGRQDDNWVELADGGWIPARNIEAPARYTTR